MAQPGKSVRFTWQRNTVKLFSYLAEVDHQKRRIGWWHYHAFSAGYRKLIIKKGEERKENRVVALPCLFGRVSEVDHQKRRIGWWHYHAFSAGYRKLIIKKGE